MQDWFSHKHPNNKAVSCKCYSPQRQISPETVEVILHVYLDKYAI